MDKKIKKDMEETIDIVKHGYRCIDNCVLRRQRRCKGVKGICKWDLRSDFWKYPQE